GRGVVHLHAEEDDAVLEEPGVGGLPLEAVGRPLLELGQDVARARDGRESTRSRAVGVLGEITEITHVCCLLGGYFLSDSLALPIVAWWAITWSMKPYSRASSAVNQRSRSASLLICSTVLPVCSAVSSAMTRFMCRIKSALILMSEAVPPIPPEGWCIITRACGVAYRLPGVPEASRNCPIEAAIPIATVATSGLTYCMVS